MDRMSLITAFVLVLQLTSQQGHVSATRSFTIDYDGNTFVKDGQPFRYISGSMHYARVPPLYWQDRLTKMYMAGLDAVQTYVPWNYHEPKQGTFNFEGGADIEGFLKMAHATGLLVILRAGPYICGEWDMGGLPSWLLRHQGIQLRTSDPVYLKYVDLWMAELLPKIKPYLYANGGPIITVQIENEYGSYPACDHLYIRHLLHLFQSHLDDDVVYFSTDGPSDKFLKCGALQGIFTTVDFGAGSSPVGMFKEQRRFQSNGPLVNSEYYTGWLDHWGHKHQTRTIAEIIKYLDEILQLGASVNMYMFEGGTNFAYWNGANGNEVVYSPQPTSYDYDAPLTEAGDPNAKYLAIRALIGKYKELPPGKIPPATPKYAYGRTSMSHLMTLYEALDTISPNEPIRTMYPISMEDMQQNFGFMLYRTTLIANYTKPTLLNISGIRDRGYVLVNQIPMGILKRNIQIAINITGKANSTLDILVENMGRLNYGCCINDSKGIISNVTLGGVVLTKWQIFSLDLERALPSSKDISTIKAAAAPKDVPPGPQQVPSFYVGTLPSKIGAAQDTFLKMSGWSKGQAFLNGFNLGRYWPAEGPQITLYVPAVILDPTTNTLVLFESEYSPCLGNDPQNVCTVEFVDQPLINATVPPPGDKAVRNSPEDVQLISGHDGGPYYSVLELEPVVVKDKRPPVKEPGYGSESSQKESDSASGDNSEDNVNGVEHLW